jgi:hypothetical protein
MLLVPPRAWAAHVVQLGPIAVEEFPHAKNSLETSMPTREPPASMINCCKWV